MRVRQKLTAVGACALATTAVLGGAAVTSHAMGESPTPDKGTMTVIAMTSDSDGAIKCVYDDIDLPAPPSGAGTEFTTQSGGAVQGHAESINVVSGSGPVDADGKPTAGAVMVSAGSVLPTERHPTPTFTVNAGEPGELPPLPDGAVVLNSDDARPGTAEECAALKPSTTLDCHRCSPLPDSTSSRSGWKLGRDDVPRVVAVPRVERVGLGFERVAVIGREVGSIGEVRRKVAASLDVATAVCAGKRRLTAKAPGLVDVDDLVDELHEIQRIGFVELVAPEDRIAKRHRIDRARLPKAIRR